MIRLKLEKGKSVVITGPKGSGKTHLACALAGAFGSYGVVNEPGDWSQLVTKPVDVVIVEECALALDEMERLTSCEEFLVRVKGQGAVTVKAPLFIFVAMHDKRFNFIDSRFFIHFDLGRIDRDD